MRPGATTSQYPDNAAPTTPSARTLAYLAKTSSGATAWNLTDARGQALIPLWTDQITQATLPNAQSFGNYQLTFAYSATTAPGGVDFNPYPATNWDDNNKGATVPLNVQVRTLLVLDDVHRPDVVGLLEHQIRQRPNLAVDGNRSSLVVIVPVRRWIRM